MFFITFYGPPGGIRTHYPRLRRPVLYPDELRADVLCHASCFGQDCRSLLDAIAAKDLA